VCYELKIGGKRRKGGGSLPSGDQSGCAPRGGKEWTGWFAAQKEEYNRLKGSSATKGEGHLAGEGNVWGASFDVEKP